MQRVRTAICDSFLYKGARERRAVLVKLHLRDSGGAGRENHVIRKTERVTRIDAEAAVLRGYSGANTGCDITQNLNLRASRDKRLLGIIVCRYDGAIAPAITTCHIIHPFTAPPSLKQTRRELCVD